MKTANLRHCVCIPHRCIQRSPLWNLRCSRDALTNVYCRLLLTAPQKLAARSWWQLQSKIRVKTSCCRPTKCIRIVSTQSSHHGTATNREGLRSQRCNMVGKIVAPTRARLLFVCLPGNLGLTDLPKAQLPTALNVGHLFSRDTPGERTRPERDTEHRPASPHRG